VTLPNGRDAGKLTTGAVPVPVSVTLCVFGVALSAKFSDAFSARAVEGVKVSATTQLAFAATGDAVEHVVIPATIVKSAAFVPISDGLLVKESWAFPVFIRVTVIWALVEPFGTSPKGSDAGRFTTGAGIAEPVPVNGTLCMLPGEALLLSAKFKEALSAEMVEGVNLRVTVQFPPPAT